MEQLNTFLTSRSMPPKVEWSTALKNRSFVIEGLFSENPPDSRWILFFLYIPNSEIINESVRVVLQTGQTIKLLTPDGGELSYLIS
jgi:hypothetical protein